MKLLNVFLGLLMLSVVFCASIASAQVSYVGDVAIDSGGYTPGKLIGANTINATIIKASSGKLGFVSASNVNASAVYLKFYDKATAPDPATDVPKLIFIIPGGATGAGTNQNIPGSGINFVNGISFILVTGIADTDATAPTASQQTISYGYK